MKIESPQENKIVVELSDSDMSELDITYDKMDYSNIETRRVVWTLLDRARRELGRDIDPSGKMLIEAMPKNDGGCVMLFTVLEGTMCAGTKGKLLICKQDNISIYEFENLDNLLDCARTLKAITDKLPQASLYSDDGRYRLCIVCDGSPRRARDFFTEYGKLCCGTAALEFTREHWKLLCEQNALERLSP